MLRKKAIAVSFLAYVFMLCLSLTCPARSDSRKPAYLDAGKPLEERVEDLLARMTLEEKVGQMNIPCTYKKRIGWGLDVGDVSMHTTLSPDIRVRQIEGCKKFAAGTWAEGLGPGGGFFTLCDRLVYEGTRKQAELLNELQRIAKAETRLKIPLLQIEEGTHGLMCSGATIFPEGLSLGSTWNLALIQAVYAAAAREGRAIGVHGLCTLVVEPIRDPRLGRNEEAFSECSFLCSRIAESIVWALQGEDVRVADKLAAFLCHYPGQSEPVSGLERGAMHVSTRKLHEVFLPPWVAGIKRCGALGAMATYPAIDGVPVHSSYKILTELLREELGFKGVLLSEGRGISTLIDECMVDNQKKAGQIAVKAGVDVGISMEDAYLLDLIASVREGKVPMQVIDRAVQRILRLKFMLGLFENTTVDVERAVNTVHSQAHRDLALQAAREGIVLLKNKNRLLPLGKDIKSIAVIGPNADASRNQLGDYTPFHIITDIVTVLDGIKRKVSSDTKIIHVKGCDTQGTKRNEIDKARQAAQEADIAIVVVGESRNTDGEGRDVGDLNLTGLQQTLVQTVCATGTPTVVVLINGRPLSTVWTAENADAVVEAWNCGERGGEAVADVLFGDYNPSGRLPITIPRHVGQLPVYYNYSPTKKRKTYRNLDAKPLYEFGYGLSYTEFTYSNLTMSSRTIGMTDNIQISVDVKNSGQCPGEEVVQLYVNDVLSTVTTPVRDLRAFKKIRLDPGQSQTVSFTLTPEHLMLLDRNLQWNVEPGGFIVMIGHSSQDIRLKDHFNVTH